MVRGHSPHLVHTDARTINRGWVIVRAHSSCTRKFFFQVAWNWYPLKYMKAHVYIWFRWRNSCIWKIQRNARVIDSPIKLDTHGQQVLSYSVFSGLWLVEKNNKEKIWCRKQTQTLLNSPVLVHLFSVSYNNVMVSCVHAINSVLTNSTNLYKFVLVCPQIIAPGSKILTQAIIALTHGFR